MIAGSNMASAQPSVGDTFLVQFSYETSTQEADDSEDSLAGHSSSSGRSALIERVLAVRPNGLELEFDLPQEIPAEQRNSVWQYPVRVFKPAEDGSMQLLNEQELQQRIDSWLAAAGIPRAACGSWVFTWNAFQIECDPQSVLEDLEAFDLRLGELNAGDPFNVEEAAQPATLREISSGADGVVLEACMALDPERVAKERAETARVVAEMTGSNAAQPTVEPKDVAGTITVALYFNSAGELHRRVVSIEQRIALAGGGKEISVATYTTERQPVTSE